MVGSEQEVCLVEWQTIRLTEHEGMTTITLSRPDCGNAINVAMVTELRHAVQQIEDAGQARLVVIRGAGETFSVGIDLRDFPADGKPNVEGFGKWETVCRTLELLPCPTIAAIDGVCAGGGLMLALACDARVATARSVFSLPEVTFGYLPGLATYRLAKQIGLGRARHFALSGREIDATEADRIGLVGRVCAPGDLESALAKTVAEFQHADPQALALARRLLDESFAHDHEEFLGFFLAAQHKAIQGETFRERVRQAHRTKRPQGSDPLS